MQENKYITSHFKGVQFALEYCHFGAYETGQYNIVIDDDIRFHVATVFLPLGNNAIHKHRAKQRAEWIVKSLTAAAKQIE